MIASLYFRLVLREVEVDTCYSGYQNEEATAAAVVVADSDASATTVVGGGQRYCPGCDAERTG